MKVDVMQKIKELTGNMAKLEKRTWKLSRRVTALEIRVDKIESEVEKDGRQNGEITNK